MILYHGSKSGIKGDIAPNSRDACDFGQGFYMGDLLDQLFRQLNTRYRRAQNVKYFDEIIEEWDRQ